MGAGLAHDPGPLLCVSAPESRYLGVSAAGPGRARGCRKRRIDPYLPSAQSVCSRNDVRWPIALHVALRVAMSELFLASSGSRTP
ncbi:hypothetical protein VTO73DRAFT_13355 [Trametes versicolor]